MILFVGHSICVITGSPVADKGDRLAARRALEEARQINQQNKRATQKLVAKMCDEVRECCFDWHIS